VLRRVDGSASVTLAVRIVYAFTLFGVPVGLRWHGVWSCVDLCDQTACFFAISSMGGFSCVASGIVRPPLSIDGVWGQRCKRATSSWASRAPSSFWLPTGAGGGGPQKKGMQPVCRTYRLTVCARGLPVFSSRSANRAGACPPTSPLICFPLIGLGATVDISVSAVTPIFFGGFNNHSRRQVAELRMSGTAAESRAFLAGVHCHLTGVLLCLVASSRLTHTVFRPRQ